MASAHLNYTTVPIPKQATIRAGYAVWKHRSTGKPIRAELTPCGTKCRIPGKWVGCFTIDGVRGKTKGYPTRNEAMRAALEAEEHAQPCDSPKAVAALLEGFLESKRAHVSESHFREMSRILKWVTSSFAWPTVSHINSVTLAKWIEQQREHGYDTPGGRNRPYSARQRNCWIARLKTFGTWLVEHDHCLANPFRKLQAVNDAKQRVKVRRSLSREEFAKFIASTRMQRPINGMTGVGRARLYAVAVTTGLRIGTLAQLTPESFVWQGQALVAIYTTGLQQKSGKAHSVPVTAEMAAMLAPWIKGLQLRLSIFRGSVVHWTLHAARHLRSDLADAGIAAKDDSGAGFDFHSFRGQFVRHLVEANVPMVVAQQLLGHAKIETTAKFYARFGRHYLAEQVGKLPELGVSAE